VVKRGREVEDAVEVGAPAIDDPRDPTHRLAPRRPSECDGRRRLIGHGRVRASKPCDDGDRAQRVRHVTHEISQTTSLCGRMLTV
jgi:hypothetical protein